MVIYTLQDINENVDAFNFSEAHRSEGQYLNGTITNKHVKAEHP